MDDRFGKYELLEKIGTGGMAEVFLAKSFGAEGLEKILVIKRILPEYSENPRFVDMFVSEAKIAVDLNHPNVVQIYDFGKHKDQFYIAMEFVDGVDLSGLITGYRNIEKRMPIGDAIFLGAEIAKGLYYAHEKKDRYGDALDIVHRDISPQNILVSIDGSVKIVDFGIAKATSVSDESPSIVRGKFSYMSPEQASGRHIDRRSDLFSLGIILFEVLCGRPLFKHSTQNETLSLVKSAVVPDLLNLNPDLPQDLVDLVYKSLEKDPEKRFQSAREFQLALTRILYRLDEIHDATVLGSSVTKIMQINDFQSLKNLTGRTHTTINPMPKAVTKTGTTLAPATPITRFVDDISAIPDELHTRERKEVVIIAGELMGLLELRNTTDQMKWLQILQEFTRIIDAIAYKNSAVVHRVNETGFVILFGIPVSSENDAELAIRVGLDLHEAVLGMNPSLESNVNLAIGIAVGNVALEQEVDASGRKFSWSFLGTDYELAERLSKRGMAKEILVGGQVFRRVRQRFDCEKIDIIEAPIDGEERKIQAYLVHGMKSVQTKLDELRHSYRAFYGRDIHLKKLKEVYRKICIESVPIAFILLGGEGVGKSTLVEHFLKGLDARDVRIVRGVVPPYQRDIPFGAIATFIGHTLRLGNTNDLRSIRNTISIRIHALFFDEDLDERNFLIESISALFLIDIRDGKLVSLSAAEKRSRIFFSLKKILERFSEKKPLLMWMDDAQNIDTISLEFIRSHFHNEYHGNTLLILSANSNDHALQNRGWVGLLKNAAATVDEIHELSDSNAKLLVNDLLKFHRIEDENLSNEILKRSGNNPLYIKEVVEVLRDRGMLKSTEENQNIEQDRASTHWLPSNVEGLIIARIDRLPLHLKVILQKVAFLWSSFELADVLLVLPDISSEDIESLVLIGLLIRDDLPLESVLERFDPEETLLAKRKYRFCNALTQNVAASGVIPEEATVLHQKIAAHLSQSEFERSKFTALIARHYEAAGDDEQAAKFYAEAAKEAFENAGAAESLRLCDKILERVEPRSTLFFSTLRIRSNALYLLGRKQECKEALDELSEYSQYESAEERIETFLFQSLFYFNHTELKRAREFASSALALGNEIGNVHFAAKASLLIAMITITEGKSLEGLEIMKKVIEEIGEDPEEKQLENKARALNYIGATYSQMGQHRLSLVAYEEGSLIAKKLEHTSLLRKFTHNIGLAYAYLGDFHEAHKQYEDALNQVRRLGYRREEAHLLANIGHVHTLKGEFSKATHVIRRGIYLARKTNSDHQLADGLIAMGGNYLELNDFKKAEKTLHEGLRIADSIPNVYLSVQATFLLAQIHLKSGTLEAARIAYIQAEDGFERSEVSDILWGECFGYMLMARASKILGERKKAIRLIQHAFSLLENSEIFGRHEVLYYYVMILPDEKEFKETRQISIQLAKEIIMERHERIMDFEIQKIYLAKDLNRKILNLASLLSS